MMILVVNAEEQSEPMSYLIDGSTAPRHMKRMIERSVTKCFEHILMDDGPDSLMHVGLINEESEDPDSKADDIFEWLHSHCTTDNKLKPFPSMQIDAYISIAVS
jgi:hypothetical protein